MGSVSSNDPSFQSGNVSKFKKKPKDIAGNEGKEAKQKGKMQSGAVASKTSGKIKGIQRTKLKAKLVETGTGDQLKTPKPTGKSLKPSRVSKQVEEKRQGKVKSLISRFTKLQKEKEKDIPIRKGEVGSFYQGNLDRLRKSINMLRSEYDNIQKGKGKMSTEGFEEQLYGCAEKLADIVIVGYDDPDIKDILKYQKNILLNLTKDRLKLHKKIKLICKTSESIVRTLGIDEIRESFKKL